jgi:hypothetical protein
MLGCLKEAQDLGIANPQDQWRVALALHRSDQLANQWQSVPAPNGHVTQPAPAAVQKPTAAQRRSEHLERARNAGANSIPDRGGSVPTREQPNKRNGNLSLGRQLVEDLTASGFDI